MFKKLTIALCAVAALGFAPLNACDQLIADEAGAYPVADQRSGAVRILVQTTADPAEFVAVVGGLRDASDAGDKVFSSRMDAYMDAYVVARAGGGFDALGALLGYEPAEIAAAHGLGGVTDIRAHTSLASVLQLAFGELISDADLAAHYGHVDAHGAADLDAITAEEYSLKGRIRALKAMLGGTCVKVRELPESTHGAGDDLAEIAELSAEATVAERIADATDLFGVVGTSALAGGDEAMAARLGLTDRIRHTVSVQRFRAVHGGSGSARVGTLAAALASVKADRGLGWNDNKQAAGSDIAVADKLD